MYFGYSNISPSYNEIIYTKLTSPLQPNTAYTLKFDVSLAENFASSSYSIQAYLSNNLSFISSSQSSIIVNNPSMLFTTSNTFTVSNGWQQGVINFTSNSIANEEYLVLGNLMNLSGVPVNQISYYYIDNISITTTTTLPTFNLPEGVCVNQTITLNNLVNPAGGVFSGTNVVNNSGNYTFGSNIPGNYNIAYTYTNSNGCVNSIIKQIMVGQNHSVTATNSSAVICTNFSQSTTTLTANSNTTGIVFTWQPDNIIGQQIVISPTSTTIYTVTGNNQGCISTATVAVNVQTACCTSTLPAFSGVAFPTYSTYLSPMVFNNSVELQSGSVVYLTNAEYLFAPNVKITVKKGARLHIEGAHLYACGNEMWDGIVVEDGGAIESYNGISTDCLIEDAYTAIHLQSQATTTLTGSGAIMNIDRTIFNKNFIGISINGYQKTETTYPFLIRNSVFTSRNFTYTPNSWPSTATTGFGLRVASTATNEFNAPYLLQNAAISNLKNPYNTQPSHKGIELISVGTTTGTTYFTIQVGRTVSTSDFNLFDNLGQAIEATNSNLRSLNNVFQNTQQYTVDPPGVPPPYTFGGNAIRHNITNEFNAQLNLTAASTNLSFGNRFYNCHYAINCDKVYFLDCQYATFRSTQSTTNTAFGQGNSGIVLRTNRFNCKVNNNHFANINNAVSILVSPSTYTYHPSGNGYGIYAAQLLLQNNYIGSQTTTAANITTQYVNNAISLQCTGGNTFQVATSNFAITTNTINRVYRGLEINGMSKINHPVNTGTNTIVLRDDNVFNVSQFAIKYTNNAAGTVRSNTLSAVNTTNTLVTLFYAGGCTNNPTVTCNNLSNSWQAFEYNGPNSNVFWRGNKMSTHQRGLVLSNNGIIGTQGSSGNPIDNEYNGSWTGRNCTWTEGTATQATNSPMWVKNINNLPFAPINNFGSPFPNSYLSCCINNTTGSYNCGSSGPPPSSMMMSSSSSLLPSTANLNDDMNYIQNYANYSHTKNENSLNTLNQSYTNSFSNSSIDKFYQLNAMYNNGQTTSANILNSSISPSNAVEGNYKLFYELYGKFASGNFNSQDQFNLEQLVLLCPGTQGAVIYQARALRSYITKAVYNYTDNCEEVKYSARENTNDSNADITKKWNAELFPNPNQGNFTIVSKTPSEKLAISVMDVNGRTLSQANIVTENFVHLLNYNLENGIYFITIENGQNEKITKKMVVTK